jgi:TRAP-type mannitol/chloroaromatic compound transport system permease small subunit
VIALAAFVRGVDRLNERSGRAAAWLTLATALVCALVVLLRYAFNIGFIWLQELYVWTYAAVFTMAAGYTLLHDGHVRVDIFYARASPRRRAWIDLIGTALFLLPWLAVIAITSWPYIVASWRIAEPSPQTGGMPGLFLLKTVLVLFCVLLGLQGLALVGRSLLVLAGRGEPTPRPAPAPDAH